jgi:hypothetical protein
VEPPDDGSQAAPLAPEAPAIGVLPELYGAGVLPPEYMAGVRPPLPKKGVRPPAGALLGCEEKVDVSRWKAGRPP